MQNLAGYLRDDALFSEVRAIAGYPRRHDNRSCGGEYDQLSEGRIFTVRAATPQS